MDRIAAGKRGEGRRRITRTIPNLSVITDGFFLSRRFVGLFKNISMFGTKHNHHPDQTWFFSPWFAYKILVKRMTERVRVQRFEHVESNDLKRQNNF